MKKQISSIPAFLLICISLLAINGCATSSPKSITPHINLSPENMQLAADSENALDFGMEVESNESDTLDNLEVLPGVRIRSIRSSGAAENAGLKRGDIILSVNDIETNHPDTLATIFETTRADQFVFMVRRDTTVFEVTVTAPKAIKDAVPEERYRADPLKTRAGYRTEIIKPGSKNTVAARIVQLWPDSPLVNAGIDVGDAIVSVDNSSVESAQGLVNLLTNNYEFGQNVVFSILKKDSPPSELKRIEVTLWDPGRIVTKCNMWPLFLYKSSPDSTKKKLSVLNLLIMSLFSYERDVSENSYTFLGFFRFRSDDRGELIDKTNSIEK